MQTGSEPSNHWKLGHLPESVLQFKKAILVCGSLEQALGSYTTLQFLF